MEGDLLKVIVDSASFAWQALHPDTARQQYAAEAFRQMHRYPDKSGCAVVSTATTVL